MPSLVAFAPYGDYPNVGWRGVTWEELRAHPSFFALPATLDERPVTEDNFHRIRQSTSAWAALHQGRISTSTAAACLGFYEPAAAKLLGVPRSLAGRHRAASAFLHLKAGPPEEGYENAVNSAIAWDTSSAAPAESLLEPNAATALYASSNSAPQPHSPWRRAAQPRSAGAFALEYAAAAAYSSSLSGAAAAAAQSRLRVRRRHYQSSEAVRMEWGTAQEATALLAVLNLLSEGLALCESGMYCGGPLDPKLPAGVQLGASPDAVLRQGGPGGAAIAVVEVKCASPFVDADRRSKPAGAPRKRFAIADRGPALTLATWHVPQLMLHMYSVGCRQAWLLSLSATRGAALMRLERDDAYLEELLHYLRLFVSVFVAAGRAPPPDFFADQHRYRCFLHRTKRLAATASGSLRLLEQADVQRGILDAPFLD